jgi:hypothetical protein
LLQAFRPVFVAKMKTNPRRAAALLERPEPSCHFFDQNRLNSILEKKYYPPVKKRLISVTAGDPPCSRRIFARQEPELWLNYVISWAARGSPEFATS